MLFRKLFLTLTLLAALVGSPISAQAASNTNTNLVSPVEVSAAVHSNGSTLASAVLTSITVSPGSVQVPATTSQGFSATARDEFGLAIYPQPTFYWSVSGGGSIDPFGLFKAGNVTGGPFTVTASSGGVSGTASVTVTAAPQVLTSIAVTPASASVVPFQTVQFSATALDQTGSPMNTQPSMIWNASNNGTITQTGLFTAGATIGVMYTVTATLSLLLVGSANVFVVNPALTSIAMSPTSAAVVTGAAQQFSATGLDQGGNPLSTQPTFTWSVNGGGSIDSTGLFSAGVAVGGPFTVIAASGPINAIASVSVIAPPPVLTSISVTPASALVVTGTSQPFFATALDQYGQPMNPQPAINWNVSGGGSIDSTGLFSAGAALGGPFTVTAASGSFSGTASVSVIAPPPVLTSITVTPASAAVITGTAQQFSAVAIDQYGQPMNPQPAFTWSASGGSISSTGLFSAGAAIGGPFSVTAASGSLTGSASVSVVAAPDFSISVSPAAQSIKRGLTATYSVTITALNGFNGTVTFSLAGQPAGSTTSFTPNPAANSATLTVATARMPIGTFTMTITGVSGSLSHTQSATLTVTKK